MNAVAFFSDRAMLPGLHVAIASLLQSLDKNKGSVSLHVFLDSVEKKEKELLRKTFETIGGGCNSLIINNFSPIALRGANLLHGNSTAYGRLYLSELLPDVERCIYLDCDLVVNRCILGLFDEFDDDSILLADGTGKRAHSLDRDLFQKAGLSLDGPCFNSGVMGMNLSLWRTSDAMKRCSEAALDFEGQFKSADQALLNLVFHDSFKPVGSHWNHALYPNTPKLEKSGAEIYHFVGSPKPWDIFGNKIHNNHDLWWRIYNRTAISSINPWIRYSSLKRSLHLSFSYYRAWRAGKRI